MVSPFKELNGPFYGKTSVPFNQECCVESLTEIGPMLLEKTVFKCCQCILRYYLLLKMDRALLLNKLEFPSRTDALCQVLLIFDPWFWEEDFKISSMYLFRYFLPSKRGSSFGQT